MRRRGPMTPGVKIFNLFLIVVIVVLFRTTIVNNGVPTDIEVKEAPSTTADILLERLDGISIEDGADMSIYSSGDGIGFVNSTEDWVTWVDTEEYDIVATTDLDLGTWDMEPATELYFQGQDGDSLMIDLETWKITIDPELSMDAASLLFIRGVQYYAEDRIEYLEGILDKEGIEYDRLED